MTAVQQLCAMDLRYRSRALLAATDDTEGSWITSKGQHIFIPKGADKGDVIFDE